MGENMFNKVLRVKYYLTLVKIKSNKDIFVFSMCLS